MKAKLSLISSTHDLLRTDEVVGYVVGPPVTGLRFVIYAESLDSNKDVRMVSTSPVLSVEGSRFTTRNSVYEFEALTG